MDLPSSPDFVPGAGNDTAATAQRSPDSAATAATTDFADGYLLSVTVENKIESGCVATQASCFAARLARMFLLTLIFAFQASLDMQQA
eukprot:2885077-Pleurochrysis_carterae.AAC.1